MLAYLNLMRNYWRALKNVKQHQFGSVLRTAISTENDNPFADITITPKAIKKFQKLAAGLVVPADVKSDSRLKAFENIRNQVSCAVVIKFLKSTVRLYICWHHEPSS